MSADLNVVIATDCGSTTTKAILIEKVGDTYRQTFRGEAPTTVEAPIEDVTRGVLNAIEEIEERAAGSVSIMPKGMLDKLSREEILDLVAYIYARGDKANDLFMHDHEK